MSEPARTVPPHEGGSRIAPGPLRDWLAAMKAQTLSEPRGEGRPDEVRQDVRPEPSWSPRVVSPSDMARAEPEDADVSELLAENLMLKAKLRLETERQDELQAILAEEIRVLREHVRAEIGSIEDLRAEQEEIRAQREEFRSERERFRQEREALRAERDRALVEREALRADSTAAAAERDALREERDLWRARTEALAQPLFQIQKR